VKKKSLIAAAVAASSLALGVSAGPVEATNRGAACVADGVRFLSSNGLLLKAAFRKVDYAPLDNTGGTGQIRLDLGDSAFLPLSQVIRLHYTSPQSFAWCD
jgi:hypothetical protein